MWMCVYVTVIIKEKEIMNLRGNGGSGDGKKVRGRENNRYAVLHRIIFLNPFKYYKYLIKY